MYMYSKEQRKDSYLSSSYFCSACRGVGVDVSGFLLPVEMATVIEAKVVVIGSQGSGKTSIVLRHHNKDSGLPKSIPSTVGATFLTSHIKVENYMVRLQVWDTAGQERFRSMAPLYYRHANAALVVYDITKEYTFRDAEAWIHELKENSHTADGNDVILCLVGNKLDIGERRQVSTEQGKAFADSAGAMYFETSALESNGVDQVFTAVARKIRIRHEVREEARRQRERRVQASGLWQSPSEKEVKSSYILMEEDGKFFRPKQPQSSSCCS